MTVGVRILGPARGGRGLDALQCRDVHISRLREACEAGGDENKPRIVGFEQQLHKNLRHDLRARHVYIPGLIPYFSVRHRPCSELGVEVYACIFD